jgi:putative phosphoesterase
LKILPLTGVNLSLKIGIISDIHATPAPLEEALDLFKAQGVDEIFCAGDIAGYGDRLDETVDLLIKYNCKCIFGNHEIWDAEKNADSYQSQTAQFLSALPASISLNIEGKRLYMVHANPPDSNRGGIKLLDERGGVVEIEKTKWTQSLSGFDYDVLIVGHTHQVFAERLGKLLLINPGSTKFNHSCAILSLPEMKCDFYSLSKKSIIYSWNWGLLRKIN